MAQNFLERAAHGMSSLEYSGRMQPKGLSPRYTRSFEGGRSVIIVDVHGAIHPDRMSRPTLRPIDPSATNKFSK